MQQEPWKNLDPEEPVIGSNNADVLPEQLPRSSPALQAGMRHLAETAVGYRELLMMYSCAIKEIRTKFEILNTDYNVRCQRNPINFINSRLKSTASIVEKLGRLGQPFTPDSIRRNLYDVAGVRVVCGYLDDIYLLAEAFLRQDDITLLRKKDYIASPKPNGYRSLHLVVTVPVFFASQKHLLPVEVQIRTTAQDYWAGLEHQLKYKQHLPNEADIVEQLRQCAENLAQTDLQMLSIRRNIEGSQPPATPEVILREKIRRLDVAVE